MRLLIVTHSYYPAVNPRAFRWTELAEYWASAGDSVDVIAGWTPGSPRMETRNGVRVFRVGGELLERVRATLAGKGARAPGAANGGKRPGAKAWVAQRVAAGLKWIHDRTWKKIYWPDYACLWYFAAARQAGRLVPEPGYDALITVSLPFTSHLVGRGIKQKFPGLTWLVDIGDPFCFIDATPHNNLRLYRRLNHRAERAVFDASDAIAVTTEATRRIYQRLFPEAAGKIEVIAPLIPAQEPVEAESGFADDGTMRLIFIGTLYRTIRDPGPLLAVFARLLQTELAPRLELHFFGGHNDCGVLFDQYAGLAGTKIFLHGVVPRARALAATRRATALINIGNDTPCQLPSKLVEYMASGRPIINFVSGPDDSSLDFLEAYPQCLNVQKNAPIERAAAEVREFLHRCGSIRNADDLAFLDSFRCPAVARRYRDLMRNNRLRDN